MYSTSTNFDYLPCRQKNRNDESITFVILCVCELKMLEKEYFYQLFPSFVDSVHTMLPAYKAVVYII